jgi:hypothetical protein
LPTPLHSSYSAGAMTESWNGALNHQTVAMLVLTLAAAQAQRCTFPAFSLPHPALLIPEKQLP